MSIISKVRSKNCNAEMNSNLNENFATKLINIIIFILNNYIYNIYYYKYIQYKHKIEFKF